MPPPVILKGSLIEYRFWFGYSSTLTKWLVNPWSPIDKPMELLRYS